MRQTPTRERLRLSLIVAISQNGVIGRGGGLPWHLPEDLRNFKRLTMGHHIIMGRATFESLGKCLPGRTNVVITGNDDIASTGAKVVRSFSAALEMAASDDEPFVIGGARVFEAARPLVDRIYLTRVLIDVAGDTFLDLDRWGLSDTSQWSLSDSSEIQYSSTTRIPFKFQTWNRVFATIRGESAAADQPPDSVSRVEASGGCQPPDSVSRVE